MTRIRTRPLLVVCAALVLAAAPMAAQTTGWPSYGNDPGGTRYSPLREITRANVAHLEVAWEYHHGDVSKGPPRSAAPTAAEATPILVGGSLYFCTPFDRVIALDPATGAERWAFDPHVPLDVSYSNILTCRGVSSWLDPTRAAGDVCHRRILLATVDARLFALDAATGLPCADFGEKGHVDLTRGVGDVRSGEYTETSPPAVAGDLVIVGSAVGDNQRVAAPSGVVRAFDARSGALRWALDLSPPDEDDLPRAKDSGWVLSTPNVWAPIAVDEARDLAFLPTGNPTPDYADEARHGLDYYGSSVVAVRASTGKIVWHFQMVHHDLWDFDAPAQPTLFPLRRDGRTVPAVVQATKMGMLFFFQRETGEPLFPVEERPVPTDGAPPGYVISPTQPFPAKPPPLARHDLSPEDAWGLTFWDRGVCRRKLEKLRYDGIYTPPSEQGSLMYPGNAGGSNWGGVAVDPERQILVANVQDFGWLVQLIPRADYAAEKARAKPGEELAPQTGTSHGLRREVVFSPFGVPCTPPPWGRLDAVDLASGELRWSVVLGTLRDVAPIPLPWKLGTPNLGGPLATGSGLVFIGAALDDYLRAFDVETGEELWKGRLPSGGQATPMTYAVDGRQYVVISAGGYGRVGASMGDAIVAFALPD